MRASNDQPNSQNMESPSTSHIRQQFIDFFLERGHKHVPSAPLVPADDPTLLFTNAGMNQFKDVFLEQGSRPYSRAVNSQKCIRVSGKHNDLESVGTSPHHHTFFEMLGNWSFGDYYKREAVRWAWELVTKVWKIDPSRLYATIFQGDGDVEQDEEAHRAWIEETGLPHERVSLHGRRDNFWEMGEVGPCGPCSELHYDLGPDACRRQDEEGHQCAVNGDCGRIIELWNLVFIQYRRDTAGKLHPLPNRHVDTGAGFERFLMVIEGVSSNFETSLFRPLIDRIAELSGEPYQSDHRGIPHRVAADHVRALAFSLADGVLPSNEGRGYVMRRILRRAARYGREIGLETPFLYKLVDPLVAVMGDDYPDLKERYRHIVGVIRAEEEGFARTLGRGLELFGAVVERLRQDKKTVIPGDDAFKLSDTYGFPLDLTELMARERGLHVDTELFEKLMAEQRVRARGEDKFTVPGGEFVSGLKSEFVGYDQIETTAEILSAKAIDGQLEIVLDRTPFYAEAGGQVSDKGWIEVGDVIYEVKNVVRVGEAVVHKVELQTTPPYSPPSIEEGVKVVARVDTIQRLPTQSNHTATHLLHTALRRHLGQHAAQAGSLVAPDRLRFDFTHFEKVTPEMVEQIERTVNQSIRADYEVTWYTLPFKDAIDSGITALFGEKYGDEVRVIHIGSKDNPYSRELCGGTHVRRTGELGLFRIVSEGAVSAGVRRIEAVTGEAAIDLTLSEHRGLEKVKDLLGAHGSDPVEKLEKTLEEKRALEKEFERLLTVWANGAAVELDAAATSVNDVDVIARGFEGLEIERLKLIGDSIRSRNSRAVALLTSQSASGSGHICCVVGDALIAEGKLKAGELVAQAARVAGGGGGGRPHMATAGTRHSDQLTKAVEQFPAIVREALEGG